MIRPDPVGMFDLAAGVLMIYTASPIPTNIAMIHAYFLIFKGGGTMLEPVMFPHPVFVLGGAADLLSAAIIITRELPVLANHAEIIAGILFLKGALSLLTFF